MLEVLASFDVYAGQLSIMDDCVLVVVYVGEFDDVAGGV